MTAYRITQAAQNNLDRIQSMKDELERQNEEDNKVIADRQQAVQARMEVIAILVEYAGAIIADGMR